MYCVGRGKIARSWNRTRQECRNIWAYIGFKADEKNRSDLDRTSSISSCRQAQDGLFYLPGGESVKWNTQAHKSKRKIKNGLLQLELAKLYLVGWTVWNPWPPNPHRCPLSWGTGTNGRRLHIINGQVFVATQRTHILVIIKTFI